MNINTEEKSHNGHEYVDLGLPSGILWATCNVGANSPEEHGDHYAWGETETKDDYSWDNYKWGTYKFSFFESKEEFSKYHKIDDKRKLDLDDDIANVLWGGNWCMPSKREMDELLEHCTLTYNEEKKGCDVISKTNGNSIFLPAAGILGDDDDLAGYWLRTISPYLLSEGCRFSIKALQDGYSLDTSHCDRCLGLSIRAVCLPEDPTQILNDDNGHQYVDLGLHSGTFWATCNVGANTPEEIGNYFAWGETEPKEEYDSDSYIFAIDDDDNLSKYPCGLLERHDDVAAMLWGDDWRMPTKQQCQELIDNCNCRWNEDKNGYDITSKINGQRIFLPANGFYSESKLCRENESFYWSRVVDTDDIEQAYVLHCDRDLELDDSYRHNGLSVRPVRIPKDKTQNNNQTNEQVLGANGHAYIDLDLPSGNLWATCNIGANTPEENGDYYAWGETETKEIYDWNTYKFSIDGSDEEFNKYNDSDNKIDLDLEDDAAHKIMGGNWHIPNIDELDELKNNCIWKWNEEKRGYDVISDINGNRIFLPAAGARVADESGDVGKTGYYSVRSFEVKKLFGSIDTSHVTFTFNLHKTENEKYFPRCGGFSIRPVCSIAEYIPQQPLCIAAGHEYVDLGLSSGLLWATCNVGAETPEECGFYFAWGETETKYDYSWSNYEFDDGESGFSKYNNIDGKTELDPEDDAATDDWEENWRMPTEAEQKELCEHCTWTWNESKKGYDVTSKTNGNSIFLPAAGIYLDDEVRGKGLNCEYRSRSIGSGGILSVWSISLDSKNVGISCYTRIGGCPIRPVWKK